MIIKKKLRDITKEEFEIWQEHNCKTYGLDCNRCPFSMVTCGFACGFAQEKFLWYDHKEMFSDNFLNQEIDIEVPFILDDVEKRYLSAVIRPFRKRVDSIMKISDPLGYEKEYIFIKLDEDSFSLPYFKTGTMYQGMELERAYTLEELGL